MYRVVERTYFSVSPSGLCLSLSIQTRDHFKIPETERGKEEKEKKGSLTSGEWLGGNNNLNTTFKFNPVHTLCVSRLFPLILMHLFKMS